ncbi:helix-turn-helix domain-containing protein [Mesorhizobium sp. KR9-304]|uniref:helix-turn-helix domain-containing protein n=1 Tax=Mesorhizobium sp. KR9-304 TaxID=3156614 RepID=UPI0032B5911A
MTPAAELLESFLGHRDAAEIESDRRLQEKHGLPTDRAALSVKEFCAWAGISRSTLYNMIAAHEIRVRKVGNRTVVLCRDALAWLEALPELRVEEVSLAPPRLQQLAKLHHPHRATSQHTKSRVASIVPSAPSVAGSPTESLQR